MDHYRPSCLAVRGNIFKIKIKGKLEVKLYCAHLPLSSQTILHLEIYLGTVEGSVTLIYLIIALAIGFIKDPLKGSLRLIPDFYISHEIVGSGGKLHTVGKAEGLIDLAGNTHDIADLFLDLFICNEVMRIILMEHLHTEKTVKLTGFLSSVDYIKSVVSKGQLFIAVLLSLINFN